MKLVCGHGQYTGDGSYNENDACNFCHHLTYSPHMPFGKSGRLEISSTSSSMNETKNVGFWSKEIIGFSSYTPSINVNDTSFVAFEKKTNGIDMKLSIEMGYDGRVWQWINKPPARLLG